MNKIKCQECGHINEYKKSDKSEIECENCYEVIDIDEANLTKDVDFTSFKPNKLSFYIFSGGIFSKAILVFMAVVSLGFIFMSYFYGLVFSIPVGLLAFWLIKIKYQKTTYSMNDNSIILHSGTIFSDKDKQLKFKNIIQVSYKLPIIENKLLKTGSVIIKSAGSGSTNINIKNIQNPNKLYKELQKAMKQAGFSLNRENLVQETKPCSTGSALSAGGPSLFLLAFLSETGPFGVILALLVFLYLYKEYQTRNYRIYNDSIFFSNGFLYKSYSFIPFESIADVSNNQSFLTKLLNIHNITISGKGSQNQVVFKNINDGKKMIQNIKDLKDNVDINKSSVSESYTESTSQNSKSLDSDIESPNNNTQLGQRDYNRDFQKKYDINLNRTTASSLILAGLIVVFGLIGGFIIDISIFITSLGLGISIGLIGFLIAYIRFKYTTYGIEKDSINYQFEFLSNRHLSFDIEKITKLKVQETIIDKIFNTCSISFYSIGSSQEITFAYISKNKELYNNVLDKIGYDKLENSKRLGIKFDIKQFIKQNLWYGVLSAAFIGLLIWFLLGAQDFIVVLGFGIFNLILFGAHYLYSSFYYSSKYYQNTYYDGLIESKQGVFIQNTYYTLIDDIKGINSTKLPYSNNGNISFNIAGETIQQTDKQSIVVSNSIDIKYIKNILNVHEEFDIEMIGKDTINTQILHQSKPDLVNTLLVFMLILGAVLGLPFGVGTLEGNTDTILLSFLGLVVGLLVLGIVSWYIKSITYSIQKDRIVYEYGIVYKRKKTILLNRIDFVKSHTGILNKLFDNGNLKVFTVGSSKTELNIKNIKNYQNFYDYLKNL